MGGRHRLTFKQEEVDSQMVLLALFIPHILQAQDECERLLTRLVLHGAIAGKETSFSNQPMYPASFTQYTN